MLQIHELVIPVDYDTEAERAAAELLQRPRSQTSGVAATWLGSRGALAAIGLDRGTDVSSDRLTSALQGRHVRTREQVRAASAMARRSPEATGPRTRAVIQYAFTLSAPERAAERWMESGPAQRAQIERALLGSTEKAIAHMTAHSPFARRSAGAPSGREAAPGFAAIAAIRVVTHPAEGQAAPLVGLEVRGVLLGVQGAGEKLVAAHRPTMNRPQAQREAERLAWRALAGELSLAYSGRPAAAAMKAFEQSATVPRRPRAGVPQRDPLKQWRAMVGDVRAQRIAERADELRDELADVDDATLLARRRALKVELSPRDRAAAREALRLERDLSRLAESAQRGRLDVAALKADAARLGGDERAEMLQAAEVIEHRIVQDGSAHDRLLRTDDRLSARRHLDAWMNRNADQTAELVAIDRQLLARVYRGIEGEVDRAALDPPEYVRTAIGGVPEQSAPEHREWVALTSKLVYEHHAVAANRAAEFELMPRDPREQRGLEERTRSLRARRGLEPEGQDSLIESVSAGPELEA